MEAKGVNEGKQDRSRYADSKKNLGFNTITTKETLGNMGKAEHWEVVAEIIRCLVDIRRKQALNCKKPTRKGK